MNKSDLIQALARKENITEKKATEIIDLIFDGFIETLKAGQRIELRGFGCFVVRDYKSYIGRNPQTGDPIRVAPKKAPFFKTGKDLFIAMNRK